MSGLKDELKMKTEFGSLQQEIFFSLLLTADQLSRLNNRMTSDFGISPRQYNILKLLSSEEETGLPVMDLRKKMVEKSPDVSRIIDRLTEIGLVRRKRSKNDGRVVLVKISAKGRKLLGKMDAPVSESIDALLASMTNSQLNQLGALLKKTRESLKESTG